MMRLDVHRSWMGSEDDRLTMHFGWDASQEVEVIRAIADRHITWSLPKKEAVFAIGHPWLHHIGPHTAATILRFRRDPSPIQAIERHRQIGSPVSKVAKLNDESSCLV